MRAILLIILFIVGTCIGSFLCCEARRLHIKTSKKGKTKALNRRSICLNCNYQLKWYDNVPIFSWLFLRGKCRKCRTSIGSAEILSEIGLGLAFLLLGLNFDFLNLNFLSGAIFSTTLILAAILGFLAIYDGLYGELPLALLTLSIICATILLILKERSSLSITAFSLENVLYPLASVAILGGLYLLLYVFSKGKWVGDGDWLLGTAIGIALGNPWLALIALFVANASASIYILPSFKRSSSRHIHLGPFLFIGFIIALTFEKFFLGLLSGGML